MSIVKLNRREIEGVIPHRRPAQFLTSAQIDTDTREVTAIFEPKAWMYKGHFPGMPICPGHYTEEAIRLAVAISAMYGLDPQTSVALRETGAGIFKRPTPPGTVVTVRGRVTGTEETRGFYTITGSGEALVNGKVAFEVKGMTAVLAPPKKEKEVGEGK